MVVGKEYYYIPNALEGALSKSGMVSEHFWIWGL